MTDNKPLAKAGHLFTIEELHRLGLQVVLQQQGIEDPITYLRENNVEYVPMFRADVGMSITIIGVTPKPKKPAAPRSAGADE